MGCLGNHLLVVFFRVHNAIPEINAEQLQVYLSLENLDLSSNLISEIKAASFPRMQLKYL